MKMIKSVAWKNLFMNVNRILFIKSIALLLCICLFASASENSSSLQIIPTQEGIFRSNVFAEPLIPIGSTTTQENQALAEALSIFVKRNSNDQTSSLTDFLKAFPNSAWKASVLCNLGLVYYQSGYFSKAIPAWEESWVLSKQATDFYGKSLGDRSAGELAKMYARLGRFQQLEPLLKEVENRDIRGPATEKIQGAREGLSMMKNNPEIAFRCGPSALERIMAFKNPKPTLHNKLRDAKSTQKGISLWDVYLLSQEVGLKLQIGKRPKNAELPLPAVVNWKVGHYAAIVEKANGFFHIQDPTFGDDIWITPDALEAEASGYFIIPKQKFPSGWLQVGKAEALNVWGKGNTSGSDGNGNGPGNGKSGGGCGGAGGAGGGMGGDGSGGGGDGDGPGPGDDGGDGGPDGPGWAGGGDGLGGGIGDGGTMTGMPRYSFHTMLASLNIVDVPVGSRPPRGPGVLFRITYNQREANQPTIFTYSNLGNKWTMDWISYATDDPTVPSGNVNVFLRGGGTEIYTGFTGNISNSTPEMHSQATLFRTSLSPIKYERRMKNGSIQYFEASNGASTFPRKIFLTKISNAFGQSIVYNYDSFQRLISVTDALGQSTMLTYGLPSDSLKVTKVTDPFGRFASLTYNASGQLTQITDAIGLSSSFTYGNGDFITSMTTPYGTTRFIGGDNTENSKWLQATDPLGQKEKLEFRHQTHAYHYVLDTAGPYPTGMTVSNYLQHESMSIFWNKKAMAEAPGNPAAAIQYQWLRSTNFSVASNIMGSMKAPLESRVFYNYLGGGGIFTSSNMIDVPTKIGRVLDDSTTQLYQNEYNSIGKITKSIDPLGRTTLYLYDDNLIDVKSIRRQNGNKTELLDSTTYNTQHLPLAVKDASGQITTYTYNSNGQLLTATNPRHETVTYTYDSNGYLKKVTGPVPFDTVAYTYDSYGRIRTITNLDGYKVTKDYDNLNRIIKVTYPDSTYEQFIYDKLDLVQQRDRLGHWTKTFYNANRQVVATQDALGRITNFDWCGCGSMKSMTDPEGHSTTWDYDFNHRLKSKTYDDGKKNQYTYENSTSRLKSITDPKGQITNYQYFLDNNLKQISYTNATIPTGSVRYTYDSIYDRALTMTDTLGVTSYAYKSIDSIPGLGAGALRSIDGPWANDSILFTYDSLGRVLSRSINGSLASGTYDGLGRISTATNPLGLFTYKYVQATDRLDSLIYPNGQKTRFNYFGNTGDLRLEEIKNLDPAQAVLSKFNYTYDAVGQIKTWQRQFASATPDIYNFGYDAANQLLSGVKKNTSTQALLNQYGYAYDKVGNRLSAQADGQVNSSTYNNLNQLVSQGGGGKMRFAGSISEPGTVTLKGNSTTVNPDNTFSGDVTVKAGLDTVAIAAKDFSNNTRTNKYQVNTTNAGNKTFTYDFNGNLLSDGTNTYEWDAVDRLVAINNGTLRSEFSYDGLGRRIRILEKSSGTTTSNKTFLWDGNSIAEERDVTGATTAKRYFGDGFLIGATKYFYTTDHLGSIREVTNSSGALQARYDYDLWGARTKIAGSGQDADFGFTGHYLHVPSLLYLTKYRVYSSGLGRWLSNDPIGFAGGSINLYTYVGNNPVNFIDPLGLTWSSNANFFSDWATGGGQTNRNYGPSEVETHEMQTSPGVNQLRDQFTSGGYKNISNFEYSTANAFIHTITNPSSTGFQVGGFGGASATNNGDGTVTFNIPNDAGTHSFFYHIVPNRSGTSGPMRTISQTFTWTENIGGSCGGKK